MDAGDIHREIEKVCPIASVSIGNLNDRSTWNVVFAADATAKQKSAALAVLKGIDPVAPEKTKTKGERIAAMLDQHGLTLADFKAEIAK